MAPIGIALRRVLLILLVAVGVAAAVAWRRGQSTPTPAEPPQWPPWPPPPDAPEPPTTVTARTMAPATAPATAPTATAPETTASAPGWSPPLSDGSAPATHPIKVKVSSGIFHVPGGRFYERCRPDRCYPTAAAAEADGYRRSKT